MYQGDLPNNPVLPEDCVHGIHNLGIATKEIDGVMEEIQRVYFFLKKYAFLYIKILCANLDV